jgi:hypothetical protein
MEKYIFSTFVVKVTKDKNELLLSLFNGQDDFFNFSQSFFEEIFKNIQRNVDAKDLAILHLTLDSPPIVDNEKRCIYGYLSSGVSGEDYKIKDTLTNEKMFQVNKNHAAFRDVFFYLQIPKNKTSGALILQRKAKFGIKTIFSKTINQYAKKIGFVGFHIEINNIVHGKVYKKMISDGNLKRIEFIKRRIPKDIADYYEKGGNVDLIPGILKTSMSASKLPENFKNFVDRLFNNSNRERIEIKDINDDFEEIEFELELNGKRKTFYVVHRNRIQPDIDVTNDLEYFNNEITIESLVKQAEALIDEVIYI